MEVSRIKREVGVFRTSDAVDDKIIINKRLFSEPTNKSKQNGPILIALVGKSCKAHDGADFPACSLRRALSCAKNSPKSSVFKLQ